MSRVINATTINKSTNPLNKQLSPKTPTALRGENSYCTPSAPTASLPPSPRPNFHVCDSPHQVGRQPENCTRSLTHRHRCDLMQAFALWNSGKLEPAVVKLCTEPHPKALMQLLPPYAPACGVLPIGTAVAVARLAGLYGAGHL